MARRRRYHRGEGTVSRDRTHGNWFARYPLGRGRFKKVYAPTELAARQALEDLRRRYGGTYAPAAGSLDEYLRHWLATLQGVREATRVSYAAHVNHHISPRLGSIPVAALRPEHVRDLVADRLAAGLSPATVRRIHSTLHAALAEGVRDRTLPENAAHGVRLPLVEDRLIEAMTEDAADAIRTAVQGTFLEAIVELLLGSGLRLGEALGLDQGDVRGNVVMVRRTKTRMRAVDISDDAAEALRRHIAALTVRGPDQPIFWGLRGAARYRRLRGTTVSHAFPRLLAEAGLDRLNVHGTRHGTASLLLGKGATMKEVAEQLGHRSITTTDRYYAHIERAALQRNVQLLNRRQA